MNVVDSSAWLEYFADGPNANFFAAAIEATDELVVPSICLLEVFKRVCQQRGEGPSLQAVAVMQQGRVVDLDSALALIAAKIGSDTRLALADSVVLATARQAEATLWTQDADFKGLPDVKFRAKKSTAVAERLFEGRSTSRLPRTTVRSATVRSSESSEPPKQPLYPYST